jgi:hypothetical protein
MVPGCVPFKIVSDSPTLHSRWLLFFKVMIISLWNLLQYHSIVRWAIQTQWAEPLVSSVVSPVWKSETFNQGVHIKFIPRSGLPLLWNQREKWLLFQVLTKEKWETTRRSGESTGRSQNISLIVPLFTFVGHYRDIHML